MGFIHPLTRSILLLFFFFNDTATTEIYTLSLHDALPIYQVLAGAHRQRAGLSDRVLLPEHGQDRQHTAADPGRSEEHTSELQSQSNLVCRLLLEKKKIWYSRPATAFMALTLTPYCAVCFG